MLALFTILIILVVGYALFSQGLLTAFATLVNVFLAGLLTFNFWEPIATALDKPLAGTPVKGYEDWICMIGLFCICLVVLRVITTVLTVSEPVLPPALQGLGAAFCGLVTGYLTAGFLVCAMQTLPMQDDFLGFSARVDTASGARSYLPPDRVWLSLMRRASVGPFAAEGDGFDPRGYFELGFQRHRRFTGGHPPVDYAGEDVPINRGGG